MERSKISSCNRQVLWAYTIVMMNIILSMGALSLNFLHLKSAFLFWPIFILNTIVVILFEPFKIIGCINKGYEYHQTLEEMTSHNK